MCPGPVLSSASLTFACVRLGTRPFLSPTGCRGVPLCSPALGYSPVYLLGYECSDVHKLPLVGESYPSAVTVRCGSLKYGLPLSSQLTAPSEEKAQELLVFSNLAQGPPDFAKCRLAQQ